MIDESPRNSAALFQALEEDAAALRRMRFHWEDHRLTVRLVTRALTAHRADSAPADALGRALARLYDTSRQAHIAAVAATQAMTEVVDLVYRARAQEREQ
jgi:hypothetical protein